METIIFMFYYINVGRMSRRAAEESLAKLIEYNKIKLENVKMIQQYFPITEGTTRVEVVTVPNLVVTDHDMARRINSNISRLVDHFEQNKPIQNIEDLYG